MNFKEKFEKYMKGGDNKNFSNLIPIFLIGLVLVITASFFMGSSKNTALNTLAPNNTNTAKAEVDVITSQEYERQMKNQLTSILNKIDGVGNRVEVMLTFESGEEVVPAVNSNQSSSTTQDTNAGDKSTTTQGNNSSDVVLTNEVNGSTKPLILKTYKPKVCSAFIVAEGAENSLTQLRIKKAVMDLLNVSDEKVNVYPMKK